MQKSTGNMILCILVVQHSKKKSQNKNMTFVPPHSNAPTGWGTTARGTAHWQGV